jgi:hypothetical protein
MILRGCEMRESGYVGYVDFWQQHYNSCTQLQSRMRQLPPGAHVVRAINYTMRDEVKNWLLLSQCRWDRLGLNALGPLQKTKVVGFRRDTNEKIN